GSITNGEFFRLPGNPQPAVSRLLRESTAYYVATFEPEAAERSGQPLRLELRSTRDKVKLHARPAVVIPKDVAGKSASPREMLRVAGEYHDLPLRTLSFASKLPSGNDMRVVALFETIDAGTPIAAATVGLFDAKGTLKLQW